MVRAKPDYILCDVPVQRGAAQTRSPRLACGDKNETCEQWNSSSISHHRRTAGAAQGRARSDGAAQRGAHTRMATRMITFSTCHTGKLHPCISMSGFSSGMDRKQGLSNLGSSSWMGAMDSEP